MFDCCCSHQSKFMKDKLEYKVEETKKGIRIDVVPKDPEKKKALQNLMKACKEFGGIEDCQCC